MRQMLPTGARIATAWDVKDSPKLDFYDMKGRIELLLREPEVFLRVEPAVTHRRIEVHRHHRVHRRGPVVDGAGDGDAQRILGVIIADRQKIRALCDLRRDHADGVALRLRIPEVDQRKAVLSGQGGSDLAFIDESEAAKTRVMKMKVTEGTWERIVFTGFFDPMVWQGSTVANSDPFPSAPKTRGSSRSRSNEKLWSPPRRGSGSLRRGGLRQRANGVAVIQGFDRGCYR